MSRFVQTFEKGTAWSRAYGWDFSVYGEFKENPPQIIASITSITQVSPPDGALTVGAPTVGSPPVGPPNSWAVATVSGGTVGKSYTVRATIVTNLGVILDLDGIFGPIFA